MIHSKLRLIAERWVWLRAAARVVSCGSKIVLCEGVNDLGGEGNRRQE